MPYTTIKKPSDYFNTKLYTGNSSTQSITGVGFQPDWVWLKSRDVGSANPYNGNHFVFDSVRGVQKYVYPNLDNAEETFSTSLTSFDSDGFSLGNMQNVNYTGHNFVSWNWLGANGTASNTDGSITSTVSANTTSGFSIVSYTGNGSAGATIGHGLGSAVKFLWVKNRDDTGENHTIWHQGIPNTNALFLNYPDASASYTTRWNSTTPTSSVFTVGSSNGVNGSGKNYIAYCFAEVKGFSKFGSYTGNGNADGTFVYTGFKPAWVMRKRTDGSNQWGMNDNKRNTFNITEELLSANLSNAASDGTGIDMLSNGFKMRTNGSLHNASGGTYIYMAFAEEPLVGDNPATAR